MRQQDGTGGGEVVRLVALQPEDFWCGESGRDRVASTLDQTFGPAECLVKFCALGSGGSVTPELSRAHRLVVGIQSHQPMLLPADSNSPHFAALLANLLHAAGHCGIDGIGPGFWMLFHVASGQSGENVILFLRLCHNLAGGQIHHYGLGTLSAAVDSDGVHNKVFYCLKGMFMKVRTVGSVESRRSLRKCILNANVKYSKY